MLLITLQNYIGFSWQWFHKKHYNFHFLHKYFLRTDYLT